MRHKKEHHDMKSHHKEMAKEHYRVAKSHLKIAQGHEKAAEETKTKKALGQITGGELKAKHHSARRVGEGVKGEEHQVREKRAYNKRKK